MCFILAGARYFRSQLYGDLYFLEHRLTTGVFLADSLHGGRARLEARSSRPVVDVNLRPACLEVYLTGIVGPGGESHSCGG